jgi:hypothetical protein
MQLIFQLQSSSSRGRPRYRIERSYSHSSNPSTTVRKRGSKVNIVNNLIFSLNLTSLLLSNQTPGPVLRLSIIRRLYSVDLPIPIPRLPNTVYRISNSPYLALEDSPAILARKRSNTLFNLPTRRLELPVLYETIS